MEINFISIGEFRDLLGEAMQRDRRSLMGLCCRSTGEVFIKSATYVIPKMIQTITHEVIHSVILALEGDRTSYSLDLVEWKEYINMELFDHA